ATLDLALPTFPSPTPPSLFLFSCSVAPRALHSFPTRRSSDLDLDYHALHGRLDRPIAPGTLRRRRAGRSRAGRAWAGPTPAQRRSEEHTSELQSRGHLVCRLLLEKKKKKNKER